MNIKQIIKSQRLRHKLMRLGKFLPDSIMISIQYRILLGRWPNLKNPKRFTEWIQWYKMHYRDPKMLRCVDKYDVRSYVEEKGCGKYLNKLYQICNHAEEIDFDNLPKKFVIKTTSGGSGDNVMIVHDKKVLNIPDAISKINSWLTKDYSNTSREWAYSSSVRNPRIIVEEYLECNNSSLDDYKFFCFNGKCKYFKVDFNRYTNHQANYYTRDGLMVNVTEEGFTPDPNYKIVSNEDLFMMIELAEILANDFFFTRVDLYNVQGKIYFGELTFYPGSGYGSFKPDSFDFELGKLLSTNKDQIWTSYIQAGR